MAFTKRAAAAAVFLALAFVSMGAGPAAAKGGKGDAAIRQEIIRASIAEYSGSCPCPYNTDRGGRSCGRRSAYSRPGGYAPKCYPDDISEAEVRAYRGQ